MDYPLATRLRDVGFIQRKGCDSDDVRAQIRYGFPTYICGHGNRCEETGNCGSKVYFPPLAELIDKIKDQGITFNILFTPTGASVKQRGFPPMQEYLTPEEAVSYLWLSLITQG